MADSREVGKNFMHRATISKKNVLFRCERFTDRITKEGYRPKSEIAAMVEGAR